MSNLTDLERWALKLVQRATKRLGRAPLTLEVCRIGGVGALSEDGRQLKAAVRRLMRKGLIRNPHRQWSLTLRGDLRPELR